MTTELTFKKDDSRLHIETTAKGVLARLAHDLTIVAQKMSVDASVEDGKVTLVLRVPVRDLSVLGVRKRGSGYGDRLQIVDRGVLSASDRSEIERKVREEVLKSEEVIVTTSPIALPDQSKRCDPVAMTIEVGGRCAKLSPGVQITVQDNAWKATGRATVSLDSLAIPPVKGPLGAFRVDDAIEVFFDLSFTG